MAMHADHFQIEGDSHHYLNPDLLEADNANVQREAAAIKYNVPGVSSMPSVLF